MDPRIILHERQLLLEAAIDDAIEERQRSLVAAIASATAGKHPPPLPPVDNDNVGSAIPGGDGGSRSGSCGVSLESLMMDHQYRQILATGATSPNGMAGGGSVLVTPPTTCGGPNNDVTSVSEYPGSNTNISSSSSGSIVLDSLYHQQQLVMATLKGFEAHERAETTFAGNIHDIMYHHPIKHDGLTTSMEAAGGEEQVGYLHSLQQLQQQQLLQQQVLLLRQQQQQLETNKHDLVLTNEDLIRANVAIRLEAALAAAVATQAALAAAVATSQTGHSEGNDPSGCGRTLSPTTDLGCTRIGTGTETQKDRPSRKVSHEDKDGNSDDDERHHLDKNSEAQPKDRRGPQQDVPVLDLAERGGVARDDETETSRTQTNPDTSSGKHDGSSRGEHLRSENAVERGFGDSDAAREDHGKLGRNLVADFPSWLLCEDPRTQKKRKSRSRMVDGVRLSKKKRHRSASCQESSATGPNDGNRIIRLGSQIITKRSKVVERDNSSKPHPSALTKDPTIISTDRNPDDVSESPPFGSQIQKATGPIQEVPSYPRSQQDGNLQPPYIQRYDGGSPGRHEEGYPNHHHYHHHWNNRQGPLQHHPGHPRPPYHFLHRQYPLQQLHPQNNLGPYDPFGPHGVPPSAFVSGLHPGLPRPPGCFNPPGSLINDGNRHPDPNSSFSMGHPSGHRPPHRALPHDHRTAEDDPPHGGMVEASSSDRRNTFVVPRPELGLLATHLNELKRDFTVPRAAVLEGGCGPDDGPRAKHLPIQRGLGRTASPTVRPRRAPPMIYDLTETEQEARPLGPHPKVIPARPERVRYSHTMPTTSRILPPDFVPTENTVIMGGPTGGDFDRGTPTKPPGNQRLLKLVLENLAEYRKIPRQERHQCEAEYSSIVRQHKVRCIKQIVREINLRNPVAGFVRYSGRQWYEISEKKACCTVKKLLYTWTNDDGRGGESRRNELRFREGVIGKHPEPPAKRRQEQTVNNPERINSGHIHNSPPVDVPAPIEPGKFRPYVNVFKVERTKSHRKESPIGADVVATSTMDDMHRRDRVEKRTVISHTSDATKTTTSRSTESAGIGEKVSTNDPIVKRDHDHEDEDSCVVIGESDNDDGYSDDEDGLVI